MYLPEIKSCSYVATIDAYSGDILSAKIYNYLIGADLITLCSMLRIPVTMHNVPEETVYRPHAWASFGTEDAQAADYAACKKCGQRYR